MIEVPKEITTDLFITDIASDYYRTAEVFRKHNIDFCSDGKISLMAACRLRGLDEAVVLEEL